MEGEVVCKNDHVGQRWRGMTSFRGITGSIRSRYAFATVLGKARYMFVQKTRGKMFT